MGRHARVNMWGNDVDRGRTRRKGLSGDQAQTQQLAICKAECQNAVSTVNGNEEIAFPVMKLTQCAVQGARRIEKRSEVSRQRTEVKRLAKDLAHARQLAVTQATRGFAISTVSG